MLGKVIKIVSLWLNAAARGPFVCLTHYIMKCDQNNSEENLLGTKHCVKSIVRPYYARYALDNNPLTRADVHFIVSFIFIKLHQRFSSEHKVITVSCFYVYIPQHNVNAFM